MYKNHGYCCYDSMRYEVFLLRERGTGGNTSEGESNRGREGQGEKCYLEFPAGEDEVQWRQVAEAGHGL